MRKTFERGFEMENTTAAGSEETKNDRPVTKIELKNAIKAFCLQCMGGQTGLVTTCPSANFCPLWPVRKPGGPRWLVKAEISDERRAEMAALLKSRLNNNKSETLFETLLTK